MTAGKLESVRVVEVGPRDGLQNEKTTLSVAARVALVGMLAQAGLSEIEVGAFVRPDRVPQMAHTDSVLSLLPQRPGVRYTVLTPNLKGLDEATKAGANSVAFFASASDTFSRRNTGMSLADSLKLYSKLIPEALHREMRVRAYISTAWACPFEGEISVEQSAGTALALYEAGAEEVVPSDTIGHAQPHQVAALLQHMAQHIPAAQTACHFHDTQGGALENVRTALRCGIRVFDSSCGGTGGCPYAPGAPGNLATENLLTLLKEEGFETGVRLDRVAAAVRFLRSRLHSTQKAGNAGAAEE